MTFFRLSIDNASHKLHKLACDHAATDPAGSKFRARGAIHPRMFAKPDITEEFTYTACIIDKYNPRLINITGRWWWQSHWSSVKSFEAEDMLRKLRRDPECMTKHISEPDWSGKERRTVFSPIFRTPSRFLHRCYTVISYSCVRRPLSPPAPRAWCWCCSRFWGFHIWSGCPGNQGVQRTGGGLDRELLLRDGRGASRELKHSLAASGAAARCPAANTRTCIADNSWERSPMRFERCYIHIPTLKVLQYAFIR